MKKLVAILLFVCLATNTFAQKRNGEHIRALKVAHITEKLNLTEKEAQQFWPVYNAYDDAVIDLKYNKIKKLRREINNNIDSLSEAEAQDLINKLTEAENNLHKERLQLNKKLSPIISAKKILLLKIAEDEFNRKLFDQWKKRRHGNREKQ